MLRRRARRTPRLRMLLTAGLLGAVVAGAGYATLSLAGGLLALALIPALVAEGRATSRELRAAPQRT